MAAVKELIRAEEDGSISFGDYELASKTKKQDFEYQGDIYKVKTFREITKLERNDMFVYESVPGTAVEHFRADGASVEFQVEGPEDAQIHPWHGGRHRVPDSGGRRQHGSYQDGAWRQAGLERGAGK